MTPRQLKQRDKRSTTKIVNNEQSERSTTEYGTIAELTDEKLEKLIDEN